MKVLYVINRMTNMAGIERILTCKMNLLSEIGSYQVLLTTYEQQGRALSFQQNDKIMYRPINAPLPLREGKSFIKWLITYYRARVLFKREFSSLLNELNPDIVVSTIYSYQVLDIICKISHQQKVKTIIESHTKGETVSMANKFQYNHILFNFFSLWDKHIMRSLKYCQCVVTLTKQDVPFWQEYVKRIEVIPNMLTIKPKKVIDYHVKRVVSAGRYMTEKGFDRLLEAWHLLADDYADWQLYIFGDEDRTTYQRIVDQYNMNERVHLMPATTDIAEEFSKSSIFVMSSRYEGFGLVLAEAMSCGLPCISFDCPYGPHEIISDGEDGFLVENSNIELFARTMEHLMSDAVLRQKMGEMAIKNIVRYDSDMIMNHWNQLFLSI